MVKLKQNVEGQGNVKSVEIWFFFRQSNWSFIHTYTHTSTHFMYWAHNMFQLHMWTTSDQTGRLTDSCEVADRWEDSPAAQSPG